jgi:hypothetical protein
MCAGFHQCSAQNPAKNHKASTFDGFAAEDFNFGHKRKVRSAPRSHRGRRKAEHKGYEKLSHDG